MCTLQYPQTVNSADLYRTRAAELRAQAAAASNRVAATHLEGMALGYLRLAEQAERNAALDIAVEFGPAPRLD